jgi:hypothetical protein
MYLCSVFLCADNEKMEALCINDGYTFSPFKRESHHNIVRATPY